MRLTDSVLFATWSHVSAPCGRVETFGSFLFYLGPFSPFFLLSSFGAVKVPAVPEVLIQHHPPDRKTTSG